MSPKFPAPPSVRSVSSVVIPFLLFVFILFILFILTHLSAKRCFAKARGKMPRLQLRFSFHAGEGACATTLVRASNLGDMFKAPPRRDYVSPKFRTPDPAPPRLL